MKKNTNFYKYSIPIIKFSFILSFIIINIIVIITYFIHIFFPIKEVFFEGDLTKQQDIIDKLELKKKSVVDLDVEKINSFLENELYLEEINFEVLSPYFLVLNIKQREPLAYLQNKNELFLVDRESFLFSTKEKKIGLPIIYIDNSFLKEKLTIGKILQINELTKSLELIQLIKKLNYSFLPLEKIYINNMLYFELVLKTEKISVFLNYDFMLENLFLLKIVLNKLENNLKDLKRIDARYLDKIIISYK